jgi:Flp pilus assembly protein TadD
MSEDKDSIDPAAMDSISVAPNDPGETRRDAGHDESIGERLERNPESKDARLDRALDESMDASDPPASTQPVHNNGPAPSSGFDAEAERKLAEGKD